MTRASVADSALAVFQGGQPEKAKEMLRKHLQRVPGDAMALRMLAIIHGELKEDDQAFVFISRAAALLPNDPATQYMFGNVALMVRKYKEGVRAWTAVTRLQPSNSEAWDGLAKCLLSLGDSAGAMEAFEKAIAADPDRSDPYYRTGFALAVIGRVDEAIAVARRGLAKCPDDLSLHEFIAYNQNFAEHVDPFRHREDHETLGRLVAARAAAGGRAEQPFPNDRNPDRPLRVAFVSGDFTLHACAFFLEGPLRAFDRAKVLPYLYSTHDPPDEYTPRFMGIGEWRDVRHMDESRVAALMREDRIDIAVDCSGWTDRWNMFKYVPRIAPVQATWLGYPNTTGLPTMDYRIVDWKTDPAGTESHCTERLARLPTSFLCYRPMDGAPREFDATPPCARPGAPVTFGSFNRVTKVGETAVECWGRILRSVPGSRLLIKVQIAAEEIGPAFVRKMERLGVSADRIGMLEYKKKAGEHFPMYREMDIALDSFPYNGTTTTCEAAWMGVPVVVLEGDTHRSRVGSSLLRTIGVPELIASSPDDYVRRAVELAGDRGRIAAYHRTLRERMASSPLVDAQHFAREFEGALREMWRAWCGG